MTWQILLIGGSSGVGKTLAAQDIGRRLGVSALLVDDVRIAMQQVIPPEQNPALHFFFAPNVWEQSAEALRDGLISVGEIMTRAISGVVAHHLAVPGAGRLIIEGDGIVPGLLVKHRDMRAVFVHEADENALFESIVNRGRWFDKAPAQVQHKMTRMNYLFGEWLREQAEAHRVAVIPARPFETLSDRILEIA